MKNISELSLESIIKHKNLSVYFQPIVENKKRNIFDYEVLIRGPIPTPFYSPLALFEAATEQGRLVELELLCRALLIEQFKTLNLPEKRFLNASPATLFQSNFRSGQRLAFLQKFGLDPSRVVIELTADEFKYIDEIGLPFTQGYYFSHPASMPDKQRDKHLFGERSATKCSLNRLLSLQIVGTLLQNVRVISASMTVEACALFFDKNRGLESTPVVEDKRPIGLIRRNSLTNLLFSQYG